MQNASYSVVLEYYFVFIPELFGLCPVAVMLAGLFTVGKLSTQNELTAIKSSRGKFLQIYSPIYGNCVANQFHCNLFWQVCCS